MSGRIGYPTGAMSEVVPVKQMWFLNSRLIYSETDTSPSEVISPSMTRFELIFLTWMRSPAAPLDSALPFMRTMRSPCRAVMAMVCPRLTRVGRFHK